jgi:hypothetical protein
LADAVVAHQVVEGIVERAQVGVDLLRQVAGQKAEALAGFDRRSGQDDALDQVALEGIDGRGDGEIGLAGAGRADAEGDVVFLDRLQVFHLARCTAVQLGLRVISCGPSTGLSALARNAAHRGVESVRSGRAGFHRPTAFALAMHRNGGWHRRSVAPFRQKSKSARCGANGDIEPGFDLPDVFVQRAAQIGQ